ncbi:SLC13 family permease [Cloacibacillus sp. An23]|uniref:SLC13 family permease n=1 Tax=Cloacibacillus sp. An23 TaxID=1965591 RepID=UPI000B3AE22B|nr:SLC13 family permease [Cloacibacillus sp. An23]OUO93768.1 carboxylate transporter [Cloacibacillus sp. An23]
MTPATLTIIILILAVISFLMEKIPVNMTIMLTMSVLVLTGLVTPKEAVSGFASTTILMLIGVMIVGSALFETGVCDKVAAVVRRYAKTERQMILAILVLSSIMSAGLSNSGTVAVFIPIILGICASSDFSRSKLLMCAFLGSMAGGRLTLVGDAAINVLVGDQIKALGYPFGFFEITKIGLPLTIVMIIYIYFIGYKFLPDIKAVDDIDLGIFETKPRNAPLWKQALSVLILLVVFVAMIFENKTGIPSYMVAIIGAVAVGLCGIFTEKQTYQLVSIKTVILLGGMTPLSIALSKTGAAQIIADSLIMIIGGSTNVYFITVVIFALTCVMTQFMSNVVTVTLLMPIVIAIANTIGVIPSALLMVMCVASTVSILTPIACPPANLIYSYGGYKFNDYFKSNIGLAIIFLIVCVVLIPMLWPLYA